ncbi:MAG: SGNH/GDSL hydrolase family protein [Myxococcales bacterium]
MSSSANATRAVLRLSSRLDSGLLLAIVVTASLACSPEDPAEPASSGGTPATASAGTAPTTGGVAGQGGMTTGMGGVAGVGGGKNDGGNSGTSAGASNGGSSSGGSSNGGSSAGGGGGSSAGGASGGKGGSASGGGGGAAAGGSSGFDPCPATGDCKVLPLGDSITFGTPTNNGGYRVELFSKAVADNKHMTFVGSQMNGPAMVAGKPFPKNNEGYPGWTISQIDGIANNMKALKDAPHIVLLHIGTNDMVQGANGAPMRLGKLVDDIVAVLPSSLVAVSSIIPLSSGGSAVTTYNQAVPGIVQERANAGKHVIYVDQFKDFPTSELTDGVHPDDAKGYPRMGDVWYAAIKSYLH